MALRIKKRHVLTVLEKHSNIYRQLCLVQILGVLLIPANIHTMNNICFTQSDNWKYEINDGIFIESFIPLINNHWLPLPNPQHQGTLTGNHWIYWLHIALGSGQLFQKLLMWTDTSHCWWRPWPMLSRHLLSCHSQQLLLLLWQPRPGYLCLAPALLLCAAKITIRFTLHS